MSGKLTNTYFVKWSINDHYGSMLVSAASAGEAWTNAKKAMRETWAGEPVIEAMNMVGEDATTTQVRDLVLGLYEAIGAVFETSQGN